MEVTIDETVTGAYGLLNKNLKARQVGAGLINKTYLLDSVETNEVYILQNINAAVFQDPEKIDRNINLVANYLKQRFPTYLFPAPLRTVNGKTMFQHDGVFWRLSPYVERTIALESLTSPMQAYQAAKQFGKLSRLLDGFDCAQLEATISGFHDLQLRFDQFENALSKSTDENRNNAVDEIGLAMEFSHILTLYIQLSKNTDFPNRVMHHDTKISNVLLDEESFAGVCVIDLDTLMPGKFISDLGDMMRTYLCECSENETDLAKVSIRIEYFSAMIEGYLSEMANFLTETEKEMILFSGKYIIYMQALRFLTDYLNGSVYYPVTYPDQNLDRSRNQFKLLRELIKNEEQLQLLVDANLGKSMC